MAKPKEPEEVWFGDKLIYKKGDPQYSGVPITVEISGLSDTHTTSTAISTDYSYISISGEYESTIPPPVKKEVLVPALSWSIYTRESSRSPRRISRAQFLIDRGKTIFPVAGRLYYYMLERSIEALLDMTGEEIAAIARVGSAKYGTILAEQMIQKMRWELDNRPTRREFLPGIHLLEDGRFLVVGALSRVKRKPSGDARLRKALPIGGLGAYVVSDGATLYDQRALVATRRGLPLKDLYTKPRALSLILIGDTARGIPSILPESLHIEYALQNAADLEFHVMLAGNFAYSEPSDIARYYPTISSAKDVKRNLVYGPKKAIPEYGQNAYSIVLGDAMLLCRNIIKRGRNAIVIFVFSQRPYDHGSPTWQHSIQAMLDLGVKVIPKGINLIPNDWPFVEEVYDLVDGESAPVGTYEFWGQPERWSYDGWAKEIREAIIGEIGWIGGHKVGRYKVHMLREDATVARVAEELEPDVLSNNRLLVPYQGNHRMVSPPVFFASGNGMTMSTIAMPNLPGTIYKPPYSRQQVLKRGTRIILLREGPEEMLEMPLDSN